MINTVIFRLLVQGVLSGNSSYARFRPRGMLVIARKGYLRRFGPKIFHLEVVFSLLKYRTEICPLSLTLLKLNSFLSFQSILPTWYKIVLHARSLGWSCRVQANTYSSSLLSHPCREIQPYSCVCGCMPFLCFQVSSLVSKSSLSYVDSCEN